jgi:nitrate/nitrite transporter NarK
VEVGEEHVGHISRIIDKRNPLRRTKQTRLASSLFHLTLSQVWNTWSPIAPAIQTEFGWSDGTFALLANWVRAISLSCLFPYVHG